MEHIIELILGVSGIVCNNSSRGKMKLYEDS